MTKSFKEFQRARSTEFFTICSPYAGKFTSSRVKAAPFRDAIHKSSKQYKKPKVRHRDILEYSLVVMDLKTVTFDCNFTRSTNFSLPESANDSSLFKDDDLSMGFTLVLFLLTSIVGASGNAFLLVTIFKETKLKLGEYLILNLVLSDLSTCVLSIPLDITERVLYQFPFGKILCKMVYPLQTVLMATSVLTLLLMSYERYRLIVTPFKGAIRGKYLGCQIFFTWIAAVIFVLPYVLVLRLEGSECVENWPDPIASSRIYTLSSFVFLYAAPMTLISMFYTLVAWTLRKETMFIVQMKYECKSPFDKASLTKIKNNFKTVKIFVTAVVVFSVCLLPTHVVWIWRMFGEGSSHPYKTEITTFCNILMYANSAINPFIFGSKHISRAFNYCKSRRRNTQSTYTSIFRKSTVNTLSPHPLYIAAPSVDNNAIEEKLSVL